MLNKKCLFGGGLYLVNIIAIFASISSDVIARTSIHDFRSELNQIAWEAGCSSREYDIRNYKYKQIYNDDYKHYWILDKYYEESRTRVIGKAIGDCVADEGCFEHKEAADIITFENTRPELYKPENWNAVILYNYVHEVINGNDLPEYMYFTDGEPVKKVLENKFETIVEYYENHYKTQKHIKQEEAKKLIDSLQTNLNNAINDIQKYVDALKLSDSLCRFRKSKMAYKTKQSIENLAPYLNNTSSSEAAEVWLDLILTDEKEPDKSYFFHPTICCNNNQLCIVELRYKDSYYGEYRRIRYLGRLQNKSKRLLERLDGLVELPTEELWNKWNPKDEEE